MNEKGFLIDLLQKMRRIFTKTSKQSEKLLEAEQDENRE
jgi:hypothetical protein